MQKKYTLQLSVLFMIILFSTALSAQEMRTQNEKKVVVTIRGRDAQGAKITKIVVKTGKEAENFDVEKYVKENTEGIVNPIVKIGDQEELNGNRNENRHTNHEKHYSYNYNYNNDSQASNKREKQGFLGVSEIEDKSENEAGVSVKITRNSGAAKAGLKEGDVLLQLNNATINTFHDVSVFMRATKPNDKIQVKYMRDSQTKTVTATVGQPEEAWNYKSQEKEACLGVYSSTYRAGTQIGAVIKDFTPISAAKESDMQLGDVITAVNGMTVKTHQEVWDEIAKYKIKEKVRVAYVRNNTPFEIKATLKACKPKDDNVIVVPEAQTDAIKIDFNEAKLLKLDNFTASPNPIRDMVNIQFQAEAVPTTVAFYDVSGRVLFQQNLNDFSGDYNQRFDVSTYAKGVIVVRILQGEKVFAKQLVVN